LVPGPFGLFGVFFRHVATYAARRAENSMKNGGFRAAGAVRNGGIGATGELRETGVFVVLGLIFRVVSGSLEKAALG
jgi:hypothetical protein